MLAIPLICVLPVLLEVDVPTAVAGAIAVLSAFESDFEEQALSATRLMRNTDSFAAEGNVVICMSRRLKVVGYARFRRHKICPRQERSLC